ncbi:hypothetical protein GCM10017600_88180 [Streptosporangium carneum]|uniref:Uncharacterized protein n=1 Tax=Streptosporangium carneum TaxID=47481 RepID=A0A9W6IB27_9ACTN|nr:hypothetical protein GCM10017600_88180 [Streptosporangium carneum]
MVVQIGTVAHAGDREPVLDLVEGDVQRPRERDALQHEGAGVKRHDRMLLAGNHKANGCFMRYPIDRYDTTQSSACSPISYNRPATR